VNNIFLERQSVIPKFFPKVRRMIHAIQRKSLKNFHFDFSCFPDKNMAIRRFFWQKSREKHPIFAALLSHT